MDNLEALELIQDILDCKMDSRLSKSYLDFIATFRDTNNFVTRNKYLWEGCFKQKKIRDKLDIKKNMTCYTPKYHRNKCKSAQGVIFESHRFEYFTFHKK